MHSSQIRAINDERLGRWKERLVSEHATPMLLVGAGHDHNKGRVVICTLEDCDDATLILLLQGTIASLIKGDKG